jgi:multicomponent Na+:H+ antiporter subunit B
MTGAYPSEVVRVVCALLSPFIAVYGVYIIVHGHYGPGGGFAGGVFVAMAAILPRLTLHERQSYRLIPTVAGPLLGGIGMLVFLTAGTVPLLLGSPFLDYAAVEVAGVAASRVRYLGIMVVEIAVGMAVAGALLLIFDVLTGKERG